AATSTLLAIGGVLLWNSWVHTFATIPYWGEPSHLLLGRFGESAFEKLTVVLMALLFVLAPATAALSFVQERVRGTAIFQQMTLLRPFDLVLGKFLGSGLVSYFIAALVLPCYLAAAVIGEVSVMLMMRMCLLLLIGGLGCQAV